MVVEPAAPGRHFTTALVTLDTARNHRRELLRNFLAARGGEGTTTYLWPADQAEARTLARLLAEHGVRVEQLTADTRLAVRSLVSSVEVARTLPAGTLVASTNQPLGRLLRTLMDAEWPLPPRFLAEQRRRVETHREANFFDITAWSLPLAFNLEAFTTSALPSAVKAHEPQAVGGLEGTGGVGWLLPPQGLSGYRLVAHLLRRGVRLHLARRGFRIAGHEYHAGTLFIPRLGNPEELASDLEALARDSDGRVVAVATSMAESGVSLGSDDLGVVRTPRIGLLGGRGVSPTSHGFAWHLFEEGVGLDHSRLPLEHLGEIDLADFNVLVLPAGSDYDKWLGKAGDQLESWIRAGGVLVAVGEAWKWVQERGLTKVESWQAEEAPNEPFAKDPDSPDLSREKLLIPGAILATDISPHHPLAAGVLRPPPVLFFGSDVLLPTGDPRIDILTVRPDRPHLAGFIWPEAEERLRGALLMSAEKVGRGKVILFSQEPAYRLFWRGTMPLFLNAVMFGPSLSEL